MFFKSLFNVKEKIELTNPTKEKEENNCPYFLQMKQSDWWSKYYDNYFCGGVCDKLGDNECIKYLNQISKKEEVKNI